MTNLTPHQAEQVALALSGPVGCLSGSPGTGKSYSTAQILKCLPIANVAVCAPTGKAAVRITELMHEYGVDATATTIHRLLGPTRNGHDGDGWGFNHDEWNPVPVDVVIVDESSMIPVDLMSSLLAAMRPNTKLLLVGDPFQLPPVGHGKPFADLISAGIPHGELTEIHRFAGRIAHVCDAIKHGENWEPSAKVDVDWGGKGGVENPENLRHLERSIWNGTGQAMLDVISRVRDRGLNPVTDVQVVCAVNESGHLSRKELNAVLQKVLNPDGATVQDVLFRVGDKLINLKNSMYYAQWSGKRKPAETALHYVSNGDIGIVKKVEAGYVVAEFSGGRVVRVTKGDWKQIDLAYAVTVHKSQGSQWPVVIVIIDDSGAADRVCSRSYHYTALSRASLLTVTIGKRSVLDRHCAKLDIEKRDTFLARDLRERLVA
jgi:exodeoxyribonuclease V alpha subunit